MMMSTPACSAPSVDEPEADYYLDPDGTFDVDGLNLTYHQLVKAVQQAGEHAMVHGHAEGADVFCADHECEVWKPLDRGED